MANSEATSARWLFLPHVSKLFRFEKKGRLAALFLCSKTTPLDNAEAQLFFDKF